METDDQGRINVMLIGHGGGEHRGAYLADTIIVASFDPHNGTVTMISVPRDLYIKQGTGSFGRINGLFEKTYYNNDNNMDFAAMTMMNKLTQITGIPISYYAIINFQWFEQLIDAIGGITIDVPESILDTTYPKDEYQIMTIKFDKGNQTMDGVRALQYARSRHSTSDFSRSYRQQQVIKAMIQKLTSFSQLTNPKILSRLYSIFTTYIHTNITLQEMLSMAQYTSQHHQIRSFVYSSDCGGMNYKMVTAACLLYSPDKSQFAGAAVLLPIWASYQKIQHYDYLKKFASMVVYDNGFLEEKAKIVILNAIDKKQVLWSHSPNGITNRLASKLRTFAFDVDLIGNSEEKVSQTTILIHHQDRTYDQTLKLLTTFLPPFQSLYQAHDGSGDVDMTIMIGADYVNTQVDDSSYGGF